MRDITDKLIETLADLLYAVLPKASQEVEPCLPAAEEPDRAPSFDADNPFARAYGMPLQKRDVDLLSK